MGSIAQARKIEGNHRINIIEAVKGAKKILASKRHIEYLRTQTNLLTGQETYTEDAINCKSCRGYILKFWNNVVQEWVRTKQ